MVCAIEDAGFEIRDCLSWLYGSGFPKSLNLGGGRGTALKPGWEPIILARKPMPSTVAANVRTHGTGGLNIDACRIAAAPWHRERPENPQPWTGSTFAQDAWTKTHMGAGKNRDGNRGGRWPANVILDDATAAQLDVQTGDRGAHGGGVRTTSRARQSGFALTAGSRVPTDDKGGASRFFYCAKPSKKAVSPAW